MWNCWCLIVLTHTAISHGSTTCRSVLGSERLSVSYPLFGIGLHCARFYSQETSFEPNCSQIHGMLECLTSLLSLPRSSCLLPVGDKGCPLIKKQATLGVSSRPPWCFCLPDSVRALTSLFIVGGFLVLRVGGHSLWVRGHAPDPRSKWRMGRRGIWRHR